MLESRSEDAGLTTRAMAFELRAVNDEGVVEGYGSVFGHKDAHDDIVMPGAFGASLAAHKAAGTLPAMLWQHRSNEPIGVWTDMAEDGKGLKVVGKLALDTVRGKEAHALLKMKAVSGLSIGFVSKQWIYDRESDTRNLTEIDLWEVSLVTFPSNSMARVDGVKANPDEFAAPKDAERALRDAGFSKSDAKAIVSRLMRMGEERREAALSAMSAQLAAERLLQSIRS
jgi:HK97 family phage prohead protease